MTVMLNVLWQSDCGVCLDRLYVECGGLAVTTVLWIQQQGEFPVAGWLAGWLSLMLARVNTQC